ncbi:PREDICTED: transcription repressor OFP14 [Nelumbo nucifera]|uniref:Transcription repressor n=2 Tax=Nelumbo nucifera TaxID=4432 RepID=A0A1U7Z8M3_NELNU|nr:PREDICTED: transcription repressor OFP14 [Nelumbo nucifera]DAD44718.1 TPA_asm: hypothetical protein HUJ06_002948 [Nelumbo nucifera]
MPKNLQKALQIYLSKLKKPTPQLFIPRNAITSSTSWILSGCKYPKTPSFAVDRSRPDSHDNDAAALVDIDRFQFENFSSLYSNGSDDETIRLGSSSGFLFESPRFVDPPPDLHASQRFFVSPGTSGSLIEEARLSASTSDGIGSSSTTFQDSTTESVTVSSETMGLNLPSDSIAVLTSSSDPYEDFRRSMKEMVEDRLHHHQTIDWEFMEELLFSYLNLNEKKSYKYILGAFVDMVVTLRQNSQTAPAKAGKDSGDRRKEKERRCNVRTESLVS